MYVLVRVPVFTRFIYGIISVCMVVGQTADHSATTDQGEGGKRQRRDREVAARPRRGGALPCDRPDSAPTRVWCKVSDVSRVSDAPRSVLV